MAWKESIILLVFGGSRGIPGTNAWKVCNTLCVWDANNFEPRASSYFLPVYWIHSLSNGAYLTLDNVKLMAVCLIPRSATILLASY